MDIGKSVQALKDGMCVIRSGWSHEGIYLIMDHQAIFRIDLMNETKKRGLHWQNAVLMKTPDNKLVPWTCSQIDLLADDWEIYEHEIPSGFQIGRRVRSKHREYEGSVGEIRQIRNSRTGCAVLLDGDHALADHDWDELELVEIPTGEEE